MNSGAQLTPREAVVLGLLARGRSYSQIGAELGVSVHTAATHVKNLHRKLGVRSARAAVWRALELGLLGETENAPRANSSDRQRVTEALH